jgi:hypothetical protein
MAAEALKIAVGVFFTLFVSFIIVGYQGILPVLLKEGVYQDLCRNDNHTHASEFQSQNTQEQDLRRYILHEI